MKPWLSIVLKIACGLLPVLYINLYSKFINGVIESYKLGDFTLLLKLIPVFIFVGALNYFTQNVFAYLKARMNLDLSTKLRLSNIEKISSLEYAHIENASSYDLIHRVRKGTPERFVSGFFAYLDFAELLLRMISIGVYLYFISPWLALLLLALCVPLTLVSLRTGKDSYEAFVAYQKVERRINDYEKVLVGKDFAEERALFSYGSWFSKQWSTAYSKASTIFLRVKREMFTRIKSTSLVVTGSFLVVIFFMMQSLFRGQLSVGSFSALSNELLNMSSTVTWMLPVTLQALAESKIFIQDVLSFHDLSEENVGHEEIKKNKLMSIEFRNVSFRYPDTERWILKDLNLTLEEGKSYALVGENGAGKTTLVKLLLGLYPHYNGDIFINDTDLRTIRNKEKLFSVAFQDFSRYEVSLRDNIIFGDQKKMKDEEIASYCSTLSFDLDEGRFPAGLSTEIGYLTEKNTNLSLGQWQKLVLIRSLAHGGDYYLLDEPTAALDPSAESAIYHDFMNFISDKSSLIITHRLGAARIADEILLLHDGKILEKGSHDELCRLGERYSAMFDAQKGWYQ